MGSGRVEGVCMTGHFSDYTYFLVWGEIQSQFFCAVLDGEVGAFSEEGNSGVSLTRVSGS